MKRRDILRGIGAAALATLVPWRAQAENQGAFGRQQLADALRAAESEGQGRLGVAVLDTETGQRSSWRGNERFPVCSTFKFVLSAAVLAEVDKGRERLDRRIPIAASDMVTHAPVTEKRVGADLSVAELCEATMVWSDNPAANLLLPIVGGPAGLTAYLRGLGDAEFRLDRTETSLNEATPGDPRDTSTPEAMLATMDRLLLGEVLAPTSRMHLTDWLIGCRTGDQKIRAGLPKDWRCGDKTGGGGYGTNNDIAILWPPNRRPILVTTYLTQTKAPLETRNAALASVGRAIAAAIA